MTLGLAAGRSYPRRCHLPIAAKTGDSRPGSAKRDRQAIAQRREAPLAGSANAGQWGSGAVTSRKWERGPQIVANRALYSSAATQAFTLGHPAR
jgi:hypothetical protein